MFTFNVSPNLGRRVCDGIRNPSLSLQNLAWNGNLWQATVVTPRRDHWFIQRIDASLSATNDPRYLQIATGQWCSASRATKFPTRGSAMAYALEYGLIVGKTAELVRPDEAIAA